CDLRFSAVRHGRRADLLWTGYRRHCSALGLVCGSHPQRREAERASSPGSNQVRAGDQPQDREDPRPQCAVAAPAARRRGYRMIGYSLGHLRRRDFLTLFGSTAAVAWPLAARAQQPAKVPTVGFLGSATPSSWGPWIMAFVQRLRELG